MQLSEAIIDDYINTFYLHDLPEHLKIFDLKQTYTFYTSPEVDIYSLNTNPSFTSAAIPAYFSVEPPVYIAGYLGFYSQSKEEFFRLFPAIQGEDDYVGANIDGPYTFNITNTPVLRNRVTISALDVTGSTVLALDNGIGGFVSQTGAALVGAINYHTGAVTGLIFSTIIPATSTIYVQSVPFVANRPNAMLYFNNQFTLRPVPDKTYRVDINAYIYPTVLLGATDSPGAQYIWQLLAIGAAKKILEDRGDLDAVQQYMPLFDEQMRLCMRKTLAQNRVQRTSTIYTSQAEISGNLNYNKF